MRKWALVFTLLLVGCGTTTTLNIPTGREINIVGKINVEIPQKKVSVAPELDTNILAKMKTGLESELKKRCFKIARRGKGRYVLKTSILTYKPGSALKRWIMPGW